MKVSRENHESITVFESLFELSNIFPLAVIQFLFILKEVTKSIEFPSTPIPIVFILSLLVLIVAYSFNLVTLKLPDVDKTLILKDSSSLFFPCHEFPRILKLILNKQTIAFIFIIFESTPINQILSL